MTVTAVALWPGTAAWFTDRRAGNLSHRRPHLPEDLAAVRRAVRDELGDAVADVHFMKQVHGAAVAEVTATTPRAAELRDVDALVTTHPGRALVVQVADCVPLLLAGDDGAVAAVHVGRRGLVTGVVGAALDAVAATRQRVVAAAIGPAIGGCCYELPAAEVEAVKARFPAAAATTSWGAPSVDIPTAVTALLREREVAVDDGAFACTRCDPSGRWFSHRRDATEGRQAGIVVRTAA